MLIFILVTGGLAVLTVLVLFIAVYNRLVFLKNQCNRSWANIDVILKQRHDEIPKLVKVCEGYMKFERETLEKVIQARSAASGAATARPAQRARLEGELSNALGRLFAVAENYPELKTSEMFMSLQARITQLENELADRREFYNDAVTTYNVATQVVPSNIVASWTGMQERDLFKISEADKQDVEIKFQMP